MKSRIQIGKLPTKRKKAIWRASFLCAIAVGVALWWQISSRVSALPIQFGRAPSAPAEYSRWAWNALPENVAPGVTRWHQTQKDGTLVSLLRFDFRENPSLRFSIADADESDADPLDNRIHHWARGAAQMTQKLNRDNQSRRVIAISNGAFFGFHSSPSDTNGTSFHVSPVVLRGRVFFNSANHRWTWGVQKRGGKRVFQVAHLPSRKQLEQFEYAAGSVQCLIKNKKPLRLEPFPKTRGDFKKQPVASTPADAGHIPIFDHMKTCRVSLAWSGDSQTLWWLVVKEPDIEAGSAIALQRGLPLGGGWTVADVQRFWLDLGQKFDIEGAINSDAGDVAQMAWWNGKKYELIPPRWASNEMKLTLHPDFSNAPQGGGAMYFVISDAAWREDNSAKN